MKTTTTMMITNRHILYQYTRPVRQTQVCKYTETHSTRLTCCPRSSLTSLSVAPRP